MQRVLNFSRKNKFVRDSMTSGFIGVTTVYGAANCLYQPMYGWYRQFAPSGNLTTIESHDGIIQPKHC